MIDDWPESEGTQEDENREHFYGDLYNDDEYYLDNKTKREVLDLESLIKDKEEEIKKLNNQLESKNSETSFAQQSILKTKEILNDKIITLEEENKELQAKL